MSKRQIKKDAAADKLAFMELLEQRDIHIKKSLVPSYRYVWNAFAKWCSFSSIDPLQANFENINCYIKHLLDKGRKHRVIKFHINRIIKIIKLNYESQEAIYSNYKIIWRESVHNKDKLAADKLAINALLKQRNIDIKKPLISLYRQAWNRFSIWCASSGIEPLQANEKNIIEYIKYLLHQKKKRHIIKSNMNIIFNILNLNPDNKKAIYKNFETIWYAGSYSYLKLEADKLAFKTLLEQQDTKLKIHKESLRKFRSDWNKFSLWCVSSGIKPLQARKEHLIAYISYLIEKGIKRNAILSYAFTIFKILKINYDDKKFIYNEFKTIWPGAPHNLDKLEADKLAFKALLEKQDINTISNIDSLETMRCNWNRFFEWCRTSANIEPLQANSRNVIDYIQYLVNKGMQIKTIKNYIFVVLKILKMTDKDKGLIYNMIKAITLPS